LGGEKDCDPGLEKSALLSSGTKRFSFWASNFLYSLAHWARDQASCLPTKSLKEQTKTIQAKFAKHLCQGQAGIQFLLSPVMVTGK